jgi:hypothetical protein
VLLVGVSLWQLAAVQWEGLLYTKYVLFGVCMLLVVLFLVKLRTAVGPSPTQMMPGAWSVGQVTSSPLAQKL